MWSDRLRTPDPRQRTILAEDDHLIDFAHSVLGDDPARGALLDDLHGVHRQQRRRLHLWVLEQNTGARAGTPRSGHCRPSPTPPPYSPG